MEMLLTPVVPVNPFFVLSMYLMNSSKVQALALLHSGAVMVFWVKLFKKGRRCLGRLAFGIVKRLDCFPGK
jgi:hypothetical protein